MNIKELRKKAIKRYKNGESPKEIYQSLGKGKTWFFKWLKRYKLNGKIGLKVKIVDTTILLILYQKALLICQRSISRIHDVLIFNNYSLTTNGLDNWQTGRLANYFL